MFPIAGPGATSDNKFTEGSPTGGVAATVVTAKFMNDVQAEILAVLAAAGITPSTTDQTQLLKSLVGRLLRTSVYTRVGGVQMVSVNGGAPTATGATVFTPLANSRIIDAEAQGAGGGSSGTLTTAANQLSVGGGGGGGTYGRGIYPVPTSSVAVTVGVGGSAAAAGANATAGAGGLSSIGSLLSCPGGGGSMNAASVGTAPGVSGGTAQGAVPTGANLSYNRGGAGQYGIQFAGVAALGTGGPGGASAFGPGALPALTGATYAGNVALNYGAGAAGAATNVSATGQAGAAGGDGIVIIREYA